MDYTRRAKAFYIFYKKILIPTLILSALGGILGSAGTQLNYLSMIGISIIVFSPILHYLTYELRNKNENFFYYNLGLTKTHLWLLSSLSSFVIGVFFIVLSV